MTEPDHQPDPKKTLARAFMVLALLAVAVTGLCYSIWLLWTLPPKK